VTVEIVYREELRIFSGEVVRFGNRCKDPQYHNLDRFFDRFQHDPVTLVVTQRVYSFWKVSDFSLVLCYDLGWALNLHPRNT
jgi:hypothetical protein